ncbi:MAG TPA: ATP synthase F1 subunit gamma [Solirubrobacterales bacterium]|jgi:F-type H+-transporting ATPase subunit gamma|nr:ATP synthase F1 subunit gamma [Solirubrobacterales bacterium]
MASQKEVKSRIASIANIQKITRAMEMVAAARLRRSEQRIADLRPYSEGMRKLTRIASANITGVPRIPVLIERKDVKRVGIVLVTGDRGLAGAFNSNIIREGMRTAERVRGEGAEPVFFVVGRKGVSALTFRKLELAGEYVGFTDRPAFSDARDIGEALTARYVDEDVDRVEMIYNRFVSPLTQHVWRQTLLPLQQAEVVGEGAEAEEEESPDEVDSADGQGQKSEWDFEPEAEELLGRLIPEYVTISVYRALLESSASELGARMTAMRNAAENAESINDELTLEMNRARQAEITQQILEVVGGAEALS